MTYQIQGSPAAPQYRGCGRVLCAIVDGVPVALRYMDGGTPCRHPTTHRDGLPAWVRAVIRSKASPVVYSDVRRVPPAHLSEAKRAAIAVGHPETGERGGYIPARRIVAAAWERWRAAEREDFGLWRAQCRAELAGMGEVVSGWVSGYELVVEK